MANQIYSMSIQYTLASQFCQNVLHYQFDDAGYNSTNSAANALITAWNAANTNLLKLLLPTATQIKSFKSRCVSQPGGFEAIQFLSPAVSGTRTGGVAASGIGPGVLLLPIGQLKVRGRVFLPGFTDTDTIDGEIQAGWSTAFATNSHIFKDSLTLAGGGGPTATAVIYTRAPVKVGHAIGTVTNTPYPVTQRRRQKPIT